jgi:hypothetical protein
MPDLLTIPADAAEPTRSRELRVESVGRPEAVSSIARMLLRLRAQPPLTIVTDEQSSGLLPAQQQRPK